MPDVNIGVYGNQSVFEDLQIQTDSHRLIHTDILTVNLFSELL